MRIEDVFGDDERTLRGFAVALAGCVSLALVAGCGEMPKEKDYEVDADATPRTGPAPLEVDLKAEGRLDGEPIRDVEDDNIDWVSWQWRDDGTNLTDVRAATVTFEEPGEHVIQVDSKVVRSTEATGAPDYRDSDKIQIHVE